MGDSGAPVALTGRSVAAPARRGFIATNRNGLARKALIRSRIGTHVVPVWYPTGTFRCVYAGPSEGQREASAARFLRQYGGVGTVRASFDRDTIPRKRRDRCSASNCGHPLL